MTTSEQARADAAADFACGETLARDGHTCANCAGNGGPCTLAAARQARADAMADAAQLRAFADEAWSSPEYETGGLSLKLWYADVKRPRGRASLSYLIHKGRIYPAGDIASNAARAAFRAVPGLRGDR